MFSHIAVACALLRRGMHNPLAEVWYETQSVDLAPSPVVGPELPVADPVTDGQLKGTPLVSTEERAVEAPVLVEPEPGSVPAVVEAANVSNTASDSVVPPPVTPATPVAEPVEALAAVHQSTGDLIPLAAAASQTITTDIDSRAVTSRADFIYPAEVTVPRAAEVSIKKMFTASHPSSDTPIRDRYGPIPCEELDVSQSMPAEAVALKCGEVCAGYEECRAFWCAPLPSIFAT